MYQDIYWASNFQSNSVIIKIPIMEMTIRSLKQKSAQLRAVGQISAALAAAWKLEETLEAITRIASEVMGVDSCSIYLQEEHSNRLVLKATTGLAREAIGHASLSVGEGLTGWAVTNSQPVAISDAINDPRFKLLPEAKEEGLRSLMAIPLSVQGRVIGAMNVQTTEIHEYTSDEIELLSLIANLAAGALEKAALYDRMAQQIQELSTLAEVSRTVTSPLYLDEMLGVVTEMAARVMGSKATTLHLLDETSGQFILRAAHNVSTENFPFIQVPAGQNIVGLVASSGELAMVENLHQDDSFLDQTLSEAEGWASLLAVPLIVRSKVIGVFSCYMSEPHKFTDKEVELFQTLANQTALAIENARLVINASVVREMHHRVKNNLQTIAMLLRLQMSAASSLNAEDVLTETINRILSIAAVHETLSEQGLRVVDVKDVLERVMRSLGETMSGSEKMIELRVIGDRLILPSREATSLTLATSELVQNAIKHAFPGYARGRIEVLLYAGTDEHQVIVEDDGVGSSRSPSSAKGLGLQIVEALVEDLKGWLELIPSLQGTRAVIRFPSPANTGGKL
jgi:two-component sensor histidine kinase/putative methionine-R-sulfoxide reductase with GAF domain